MKRKVINIGLAVALAFYTSSCGKDFLDVNTDPNNATVVSPDLVFPAAVTSTASAVGGEYAILGGIWSQYWAQNNGSSQYKTIDAFNLRPLDFNNRWTEVYTGALNDYKNVEKQAVASENWNLNLMATVMEQYTYQVMADLYDQIPYDEALKGEEGILAPHFQPGEQVYDGLIAKINEALSKPVSGTSLVGKNDVVFQGNMSQWLKFANTLKLKIYLRQSAARPSVAEAGVRAVYGNAAGFLTSDAKEDMFSNVTGKRNPLYEQDQSSAINTNSNLRASSTLFSFLTAKNDPRLPILYIPGSGGQKSLEQGNFLAPGLGAGAIDPASLSRARISPTAPVYFISEAESYFLQAEAVLRGWGTGDAKALYESGVRASFKQLNALIPTFEETLPANPRPTPVTQAQIDALLAGVYAYPSGGSEQDKLNAIITQKWVAFAGSMQGIQAFFDRNRTEIPKTSAVPRTTSAGYVPGEFVYPVNGVTAGVFAKRLIFPEFERTRNPNTPAQVPITTAVWWDK